ncbi:hypothetical protein EDE12_1011166 [Methylosinus sp. sav-2]|uniref:hypothetical protein n=1 Tax=unclassified Methylosinus TaxID=2624500 RepID=UPI000465DD83|nr:MULTISPECIES: hypothetical protein [unclassified Methylosinus]TDX67616.1 hypothetical protein EDE12_1011166 [Methylosinus sp. sav-2]
MRIDPARIQKFSFAALALFSMTGGAIAQEAAARGRAYFAGATIRGYDPFHGTQVEYHVPNGNCYLWYPGNTVILHGYWQFNGDDLCYRYPVSGINPSTGEPGEKWSCRNVDSRMRRIRERAPGDILGLSRASRPRFILPKDETTLADLLREVRSRR